METRIKEKGIIFSGENVRAILAGKKTQTRRVVKPQPYYSNAHKCWMLPHGRGKYWMNRELREITNLTTGKITSSEREIPVREWLMQKSPYVVGNRLRVRETWGPCEGGYIYKVDESPACKPDDGRWHSPIHMPSDASRLTLEITDVRVERVQDISEADAVAEGVREWSQSAGCLDSPHMLNKWCRYSVMVAAERKQSRPISATALGAFALRWDQLNASRYFPWAANPWVWAVTFKVVQGRL